MYLGIATTQAPHQAPPPPVVHPPTSRLSQGETPLVVLRARRARFNPQRTPCPLRIMPQVRTRVIPYLNHPIYLTPSSRFDGPKRDERPLPPRRTCHSGLWCQDSAWFTSKYLPDSHIFTVESISISVLESSIYHD